MTDRNALPPHPGKLEAQTTLSFSKRDGLARTTYVFSYSGALIVETPLPIIEGIIDGMRFEIFPPTRIGEPAFRATPQFTQHSISKLLVLPDPLPFPIQVAAFPAPNDENGARMNVWNGPGDTVSGGSPDPPPDTIIFVLHGPDSLNHAHRVEKYLLDPLLEWLRVLSDQWWIGRSYERISGSLHFIAGFDAEGRTVGTPTPIARTTTGGPRMKPITADLWTAAADKAAAGHVPGSQGLATDGKFMLSSREFRAACVLACSAFESARDNVLAARKIKLRALRCPETDLLRQLSTGFGATFDRNMENEEPKLFELLRAFWIARGHAAHGKNVQWRYGGRAQPMDEVEISILTNAIDDILEWIMSVEGSAVASR